MNVTTTAPTLTEREESARVRVQETRAALIAADLPHRKAAAAEHQLAVAIYRSELDDAERRGHHYSPNHDPLRAARCICGTHLSAPTTAAHEAHVAEATRATT